VPTDVRPVKITCTEAARLIGVSPRTLEAWRRNRRGPEYFHPRPGRPFYLLSDIDRWLAGGRVETFYSKARGTPRYPAAISETITSSNSLAEGNDE